MYVVILCMMLHIMCVEKKVAAVRAAGSCGILSGIKNKMGNTWMGILVLNAMTLTRVLDATGQGRRARRRSTLGRGPMATGKVVVKPTIQNSEIL